MNVGTDIRAIAELISQGRHKTALKSIKPALRKNPDSAPLLTFAGIALAATGRLDEAVTQFRRAIRQQPENTEIRCNLAQALLQTGHPAAALSQIAALGSADALYLAAQAHAALGDADSALETADRAIAAGPAQARHHNLRAVLRQGAGDDDGALEDFLSAVAMDPNNVDALVNCSLPLARAGRSDEAGAALRRAVALGPGHLGARMRLAQHHMETGASHEAREAARAALGISPRHGAAYDLLARLCPRDETAALRAEIARALKAEPRRSPDRAILDFAAGHLALLDSDGTEAARHLARANAAIAATRPFDAEADARLHADLAAAFPVAPPPGSDRALPRPVFVLGLPRSGTSLAEAVLAAHPAVQAMGERITAARLLAPLIEARAPFDPEAADRFAAGYRAALPGAPGKTVMTDKMPENYRLIGHLLTAFPEARVIHLTRDPMDVALSLWRGIYAGSALSYSYDLAGMAAHFNNYARLMSHWNSLFADRILDLPYDALVGDIDAASHRIAAFVGLDWEPGMAAPHETRGAVLTASAPQLRQPVHARSIGGGARHAGMLQPFAEALDPALWPTA